MACGSAVLFLMDDTAKTGFDRPMMLRNIMGTPALAWLCEELAEAGISRFFLVCPEKFREAAAACFPAEISLTVPENDISDRLHVFLSTAEDHEESVIVITRPVLFLPGNNGASSQAAPVPSGAYTVDRRAMMDALDDRFSFQDLWKESGCPLTDGDGYYQLSDREDIIHWQEICRRRILLKLARQGVEIRDYNNTYAEPDVFVGSGTVLLPGTVLLGGTVIGRNCIIGPYATLERAKVDDDCRISSSCLTDAVVGYRTKIDAYADLGEGTVLGNGCTVGAFTCLRHTVVGDNAVLTGLNHLSDCDVGRRSFVGAGTVAAEFDRAQHHHTEIGENAFLGCNTALVAPVSVGNGAYTAAGTVVTDNVPEQALAIGRARQTMKKEWAADHKQQPDE